MLIITCPKHPKYNAIRDSKVCPTCHTLYRLLKETKENGKALIVPV